MVTLNSAFGQVVRERREQTMMPLREMARQVPMSPAYLSKIERGDFPPPAEEKIKRIAQILDLDPDWLLAVAGRVASDLPEAIREDAEKWAAFVRNIRCLEPEVRTEALDFLLALSRELKEDPRRVQRLGEWWEAVVG